MIKSELHLVIHQPLAVYSEDIKRQLLQDLPALESANFLNVTSIFTFFGDKGIVEHNRKSL